MRKINQGYIHGKKVHGCEDKTNKLRVIIANAIKRTNLARSGFIDNFLLEWGIGSSSKAVELRENLKKSKKRPLSQCLDFEC